MFQPQSQVSGPKATFDSQGCILLELENNIFVPFLTSPGNTTEALPTEILVNIVANSSEAVELVFEPCNASPVDASTAFNHVSAEKDCSAPTEETSVHYLHGYSISFDSYTTRERSF
ncbi:hypothetical protein DY000_02043176 [Brassica cretica]|uniref:ZP domain-containing protein n=1 Tax=Brassica cretica TaxID=69181 RepID=A0ABQ7BBZ5_BRACR|nr:hypothetical protein DY000_02043176 [Brassica cretica]